MSRVGKQPVLLPKDVKASIEGGVVAIEGPKGKISYTVNEGISVAENDGMLVVSTADKSKQAKAGYGATRAHLQNMVIGVTDGWKKVLELHGVGFTAKLAGSELTLAVGYSHDVKIDIPQAIDCKVSKTNIELESYDKRLVGEIAATIRRVCPPEPYLAKGIRYDNEQVRRKAGKAGKK